MQFVKFFQITLISQIFMLKKVFLLFIISVSISAFGQTTVNYTIDSSAIPDLAFVQTKFDLKDVVTKADQKPEFPGGIEAFKRKYFENTETLNLKNKEKVDTRLYFIVEKNGYVRYVTSVGSNKKHVEAAEQGVRRIFARWKPATINGKPVRYLMYFPLFPKKY